MKPFLALLPIALIIVLAGCNKGGPAAPDKPDGKKTITAVKVVTPTAGYEWKPGERLPIAWEWPSGSSTKRVHIFVGELEGAAGVDVNNILNFPGTTNSTTIVPLGTGWPRTAVYAWVTDPNMDRRTNDGLAGGRSEQFWIAGDRP